jgi:hypothetical protein
MRTLLAATVFLTLLSLPLGAQAPDAREQEQVLALIKDIKAQQAQMGNNQNRMTEKLTTIAEDLRVSRLLTGRSN